MCSFLHFSDPIRIRIANIYRERFLQFFFGINWLFSTFTNPLSILHTKAIKVLKVWVCTIVHTYHIYPGSTFMSFSTTFIWEMG